MMQAALTLSLSTAQAAQLCGYCAAYRVHAWRELAPTAERNQTMRAAQAVQGRLAAWSAERRTEPLLLAVTAEEKQALRHIVCVLMQVSGTGMSSEERSCVLGELARYFKLLGHTSRPTQAL
jgi:hypothetical protein